MMQVLVEHEAADLLERPLDGENLIHDIDAVRALLDHALDTWILGDAPFTARPNPDLKLYATYDQLMRLEEWLGRESEPGATR